MGQSARLRCAILAAGLWWGSLSALMLVVVPMLFAHLPSAQIAGSMAARLFSAQTWLSCGCGLLLLMAFNRAQDEDLLALGRLLLRWVVAGMLAALLVEFALAPRILAARGQSESLRLWHSLGSALYLVQWGCALRVFWLLTRRP
jgi:hypothetical protein